MKLDFARIVLPLVTASSKCVCVREKAFQLDHFTLIDASGGKFCIAHFRVYPLHPLLPSTSSTHPNTHTHSQTHTLPGMFMMNTENKNTRNSSIVESLCRMRHVIPRDRHFKSGTKIFHYFQVEGMQFVNSSRLPLLDLTFREKKSSLELCLFSKHYVVAFWHAL